MTQCNATAELMDANMQIIPGITLRCELEAGHNLAQTCTDPSCPALSSRYVIHAHGATPHACTLTWADPTADELAEVLDPDEAFDLEVDIADEAVLEQQQNNAIANGEPVDERDYPRELMLDVPDYSTPRPTLDPIPEANPRCRVCGREVVRDWLTSSAWRHLAGDEHVAHHARV